MAYDDTPRDDIDDGRDLAEVAEHARYLADVEAAAEVRLRDAAEVMRDLLDGYKGIVDASTAFTRWYAAQDMIRATAKARAWLAKRGENGRADVEF